MSDSARWHEVQIQHRDTEAQRSKAREKKVDDIALSERVIGCAIEVHRHLGPGLLESAYEDCLCFELGAAGLAFRRQVELPVVYKGMPLAAAYRIDILIADRLVVEVKSVERILAVHEAQLLTYLRLGGHRAGLLLNFNHAVLKEGIRRVVT
jgi:GxxExxY protein